jgi:O-methyltransferase
MQTKLEQAYHFHNVQVDSSIINREQILNIITKLEYVIENNIEGDVVELGCYVGESSKYKRKLLNLYNSDKELVVYDSFEGLPPLSQYEKNTGWRAGTLKTTEEVLKNNFINNGLKPPKVVKGWFKDIKDEDLPEKICFAFLDGDFYDSIYDSLIKIYDRMSEGGVIMFHDYRRPDLPGVDAAIKDFFKQKNIEYDVETACNQLGYHVVGGNKNKIIKEETKNNSGVTIVTGLWNIKRDELTQGWSRSYEHYIEKFNQILDLPNNLIVFGDKELEEVVFKKRNKENTLFVHRDQEWFKNGFYDKIQKIRKNEKWINQAGWLKESTQAKLDMYNPLVMSKPFLLNDARILDIFDSTHMFWLDAGITNTVHPGYFTHDKVLDKLNNINKISFVAFPYDAEAEIHGFDYKRLCDISGSKVNKVCRGGFFGGPVDEIPNFNHEYYNLMSSTLNSGYMGTEESLFTILAYRYASNYQYFEINPNGLINKFFEDLKNDKHVAKTESKFVINENNLNVNNVGLYVITFNSPKQFETLIDSFYAYDSDFVNKPKKFLLNNSTDKSTDSRYKELCEEYGFIELRFEENLGICGGRQYIAEHAEENNLDYYFFFEDDMFFYPKKGEVCKNGFNRYSKNLYKNSLNIIKKRNFDFLKLSFTEFFGDNITQWAWYNVPQSFREKHWPEKPNLPVQGFDSNAPKTKLNKIGSHNGLAYADGEIYYSNWPQVVSKYGNKKMFLTEKWARPYEQTWMSYIFQKTVEKEINPAILLLTPTEHDRFDHYDKKIRKES